MNLFDLQKQQTELQTKIANETDNDIKVMLQDKLSAIELQIANLTKETPIIGVKSEKVITKVQTFEQADMIVNAEKPCKSIPYLENQIMELIDAETIVDKEFAWTKIYAKEISTGVQCSFSKSLLSACLQHFGQPKLSGEIKGQRFAIAGGKFTTQDKFPKQLTELVRV